MESQGVFLKGEAATNAGNFLSVWINRADVVIFKVVMDYIIRNFDPTGINIWGLIDSFYCVFIKQHVLFVFKSIKRKAKQFNGHLVDSGIFLQRENGIGREFDDVFNKACRNC